MDDPTKGPAATPERDAGGRKGRVTDGIRQGLGVLGALKDALDEAITEARDRGDLSPDRAKEAVRSALHKVQEAAGEAKDRLDIVSRKDFEHLREQVDELKVRLENLERRAAQGPGAWPARAETDASG